MEKVKAPKKKNIWKRLLKVLGGIILGLLLLVVILIIAIQTRWGQNIIRKQAISYLQDKLDTKIDIGKLYISFSTKVVLEDLYVEDRKQDTLLSAGKIQVNISIWNLLFDKLDIKEVQLQDITAKIKRELPDTAFNFQFIVDAFSSPSSDTSASVADTSAAPFLLRSVLLDNVRFVYKDVVTGNDVTTQLGHFGAKINGLDFNKLIIDIKETAIENTTAIVIQTKPLTNDTALVVATEPTTQTSAAEGNSLQLLLRDVGIKNLQLDFRDSVGAFYTQASVGSLAVQPRKLDLDKMIFDAGDITIDKLNAIVRQDKTAPVVTPKKTTNAATTEDALQEVAAGEAGLQLAVNSLKISNSNVQYDDNNSPRIAKGMDYAHLKVNDLNLEVDGFLFKSDSIKGIIKKGELKEQSGFVLEKLQTSFLYGSSTAYLKDLVLKTPGTLLQRDIAIRYPSIEAIGKDIGVLYVDMNLDRSKVVAADILTFVPDLAQQEAFANPAAAWQLHGRIRGFIKNLAIEDLELKGWNATAVKLRGQLKGLPDMDRFTSDLAIDNISTTRQDLEKILPPGTLPANITLPNTMQLTGKIKGGLASNDIDARLRTDLGNVKIKGRTTHITDAAKATYDVNLATESFKLGKIMNDSTLGPLSVSLQAKGKGFDPKTADAVFKGTVHSFTYNQYEYKDLAINGDIRNQVANLTASISDPNIDLDLTASANFAKEYPAIQANLQVDSLKTLPLHLTPEAINFAGTIKADFENTNPDDLIGELMIERGLLVMNNQPVDLDSVRLVANVFDDIRYLQLFSPVANVDLYGEYKLTQIGDVVQHVMQPYFKTTQRDTTLVFDPYNFTLNATISNSPQLKAFVPDLEHLETVTLNSFFSDFNGWHANLKAPSVSYAGNKIDSLVLDAGTNQAQDSILANINVKNIAAGGIVIQNTNVQAGVAENNLAFVLNIKDENFKERYNLQGLLEQNDSSQYKFSIVPKNLKLNYNEWKAAENNSLVYSPAGLLANNFLLARNNEELKIQSTEPLPTAPLQVSFNQFGIGTLLGFVMPDTTLANGKLNGSVVLSDLFTSPVFTGDLTIDNLQLYQDTVGNVKILASNSSPGVYDANVTITGGENNVQLAGKYYQQTTGGKDFDFNLDINKLTIQTAQAFSAKAIRYGTGSVNGKLAITGTIKQPSVLGSINFDKAGFNVSTLNNYFKVDQQKIIFDQQGLRFNRFAIKDTSNNDLILNGTAATQNFTNYKFNLNLRADNFQALNSVKRDNDLFYGKLFFNTDLQITGTEAMPVIDGRLKVNEGTAMTVVLPQSDPGIEDREGVVEFVDMDAPLSDSLWLVRYDSLNTSSITGMDVSVNVEIDPAADFTIVIDESNGDYLNVKGEALLSVNIDKSGEIVMTGTYEINEGEYQLTIPMAKRKFSIEKGSKITWGGEPTAADINITAKYVANAVPLDLVKGQLGDDITATQRNMYMQRLPFDVLLKLTGQLLQPQVAFDIVLPENKSYSVAGNVLTDVRTKLDQLRLDEGEMNKQVFSLLVLTRFFAETPFDGTGVSANTMVRQSVSKLLTEQLNRMSEGLIKGVDLNFDLQSSEDYSTGARADRTDLNIGLSKKMFDDRLTVSIGSNFELEGPQNSNQQAANIAGNIAIDYRLSKDGRYMLRAYRKNEFQGVIDGYIVETGLGFVITLDYNRFRDIFRKQKTPEQRRKEREEREEKERQAKQAANP